jgi:CBS-domain-containing membrane protein
MQVEIYFTQNIDSSTYPGNWAKAQAIVHARTLTTNRITGFDWIRADVDEWYLYFKEVVLIDVEEQKKLPLHMYSKICNAKPQIEGGEWSCNRRVAIAHA